MKYIYQTMGDPTVKCYRPGDPEFDRIASEITPIQKVKNPNPKFINTWDDGPVCKPKTRLETPDKLR